MWRVPGRFKEHPKNFEISRPFLEVKSDLDFSETLLKTSGVTRPCWNGILSLCLMLGFWDTVLPAKNVRGRFPAFLAFKATDQRHIIILLFETLQFWFWWNFCGINQFWGTAPMDLKNQVWTKKIAKKSFFRLNFEVLLINRSFWNFLWSLQFAWILNYEFIKIL